MLSWDEIDDWLVETAKDMTVIIRYEPQEDETPWIASMRFMDSRRTRKTYDYTNTSLQGVLTSLITTSREGEI